MLKINIQTLTFAHAKLLEFHILELKILNFLIQYKFLTYEHFPYYGLPHVILMPARVQYKINLKVSSVFFGNFLKESEHSLRKCKTYFSTTEGIFYILHYTPPKKCNRFAPGKGALAFNSITKKKIDKCMNVGFSFIKHLKFSIKFIYN